MNEAKTRSEISRQYALAVQWRAKSGRAANDGHHMDAAQHLKRYNECILAARHLEQELSHDTAE